jgi:hypothetical protein
VLFFKIHPFNAGFFKTTGKQLTTFLIIVAIILVVVVRMPPRRPEGGVEFDFFLHRFFSIFLSRKDACAL